MTPTSDAKIYGFEKEKYYSTFFSLSTALSVVA